MSQREEITTFSEEQRELKATLEQRGYRVRVLRSQSEVTPYWCELEAQSTMKTIHGATLSDALANALRHTQGNATGTES